MNITHTHIKLLKILSLAVVFLLLLVASTLLGCSIPEESTSIKDKNSDMEVSSQLTEETNSTKENSDSKNKTKDTKDTEKNKKNSSEKSNENKSSKTKLNADEIRAKLNISEDYRSSFVHGDKGSKYQKYIVLHDTESDSDASSVINWWDSNGNLVAAHFVINKDGSIVQCVPMDKIAHHSGFGDTGHNAKYGVEDESHDDKKGTTSIGNWASDYGMNSYSVGIELVHVGGSGDYPEEQLEALDTLIAYIDAYYGFESKIIDHKAWRTGNSDTSEEFSTYLKNYQNTRTHNGS